MLEGITDIADVVVSVSEFVALLNQSLEYVFPGVVVTGELANFRISKNRWVYFDIKDDESSVKCFGTVYQLSGPLEDGMLLQVRAQPRLHNLYGFSLNVQSIRLAGEGTIRRANDLLAAKLEAEGLFAVERKRLLPYPPSAIGLVASGESAAYVDFMKVLNARWGGVEISHIDVQVQGEVAPGQIVAAIERFNGLAEPPEVLVLTRGGGSAEDLAAFSDEQVVRAVAASRIPTLVAIGHEVDISLAELAADLRASTPSNAAELLVPDRQHAVLTLNSARQELHRSMLNMLKKRQAELGQVKKELGQGLQYRLRSAQDRLKIRAQLLAALSPTTILARGYAVVRSKGRLIRRVDELAINDMIELQFSDGLIPAIVQGNSDDKE